jgi:4'-phosphopantetheinyl transferase
VSVPVELALVRTDALDHRRLFGACGGLLDEAERARVSTYRLERDQCDFVAGRVVLRRTLSRLRPRVEPGQWRFRVNPWGRPEVSEPPSRLRFNLSHAPGLLACAVSEGLPIGVDVEEERERPFLPIAADFFAPPERAALERLRPEARRERFFALWTLKEAYIKARGMGLAIELDRFAFRLRGRGARLWVDPDLGDHAGAWRFVRLRPTDNHQLALAVRTPRRLRVGLDWVDPSAP